MFPSKQSTLYSVATTCLEYPAMRRDPKQTPEFIYKELCIYSYMFQVQSPSKYSPFDAIHLWRLFPTVQHFLNSPILMPFSASAIFFGGGLFHISKTFLFEDFFHPGKQTNKKVTWGKVEWIGRVGHGCHGGFLAQNCWTLSLCGQVCCKSLMMK